jgi:2-(1,2-epoxy-1,2-dihydrophenyl)acetyl-CoA isomerase
MEQTQFITYEVKDSIATITFNRPESLNSLHPMLMEETMAMLCEAEKDDGISVIVLTGAGKAFCSGGDIQYMDQLTGVMDKREYISTAGRVTESIMNLGKPVIAMVNGVAAGAGFNIALACDIIFASDKAKFAQSFSKVGLIPDAGGTYNLPRIVGLHKAKELMFLADLITADEAFALGIVNYVIPQEDLKETTYTFAERLSKAAPISVSFIKSALNSSLECTLKEVLDKEVSNQTICLQTEDCKEGLNAFKEKRAPKFSGR